MKQSLGERLKHVPVSWRIIIGLLSFVVLGTVLLMLPASATSGSLSWNTSLFFAVSALTCTGLATVPPGAELSLFGQCVLLGLIQIGGIGYMTLAILVLRIAGRSVALADRLALQDALGVVNVEGVLSLAKYVFFAVIGIEAIGVALLYNHWTHVPESDRLFFSIFHAVSSFCNAGFDLFVGHPRVTSGFPMDPQTQWIKGSLIVLGGIGMPVLFDLFSYPKNGRLNLHTRITVAVVFWLIVLGGLAIFLSERRPGGTLAGLDWGRQLGMGFFQSVSCRSAGFAGLPAFETVLPATQLIMLSLMFIGSAPASAGGGITTGTFAVLLLSVFAYAKGRQTAVVGGRAIPGNMVRKAAAVLTISLTVCLFATLAILMTHPTTLDKAAFEVISAFATCGLTLAFTSELTVFGQLVIAFVMIWGRLGALTIIFALTQKSGMPKIQYPEEKILIG